VPGRAGRARALFAAPPKSEPPPKPVPAVALQGCRIARVLDGAVEIVHASPADRAFPDRVNESLGLCFKAGPAHDVCADGRALRYPADALCIRTPGTVWSARATGPAGFLSVDVEPALLPEGGLVGAMRFVVPTAVPGLTRRVAVLRSDAAALDQEVAVAELVDALVAARLVAAPALDAGLGARAANPRAPPAPDLRERRRAARRSAVPLSDAVGTNRFVLLRAFRRAFGVPPHAFVLQLRVERARARLARGASLSGTAFELGFADQSHFSRVFARVVGLAPGAYRREMRRGTPRPAPRPTSARSIAFKTPGGTGR
jgi:AraC-like DNA-binding protein